MTTESVKIVIQADDHSVPVGQTVSSPAWAGGRENLIAFRTAVEALSNINATVFLGDMSDVASGAIDAYGLVAGMPNIYAVLGNHDISGAANATTAKADIRTLYGMPANYYAADVDFCRLIILDTNLDINGDDNSVNIGYLHSTQLAWLESELTALGADRPALICLHHTTAGYLDSADASALAALISTRRYAWAIMGHSHPGAMRWDSLGGRPAFTLRALCDERFSVVTIERRCGTESRISITENVVVP